MSPFTQEQHLETAFPVSSSQNNKSPSHDRNGDEIAPVLNHQSTNVLSLPTKMEGRKDIKDDKAGGESEQEDSTYRSDNTSSSILSSSHQGVVLGGQDDHHYVQHGRVKPKLKLCPDISSESPVLVLGAGLAGLACALSLSSLSFDTVVIEQRSYDELVSTGAGINLQAKAIKCLKSIGISTSSLVESGNIILKQNYYCPDGRLVCALDKSLNGDDETPGQIAIHRGELMRLLLEKVTEEKKIQLCNGCKVTDIQNGHKHVSIKTNGKCKTEQKILTGSAALAADGIHSRVRQNIIMPSKKDPRKDHGVTHYRGVAENFPMILDGKTMLIVGGTEVKLVIYPITSSAKNGRQNINWILCLKEERPFASSQQEDTQNHIMSALESNGFDLDFLNLRSMVTNTKSIQPWKMIDIDPLETWTNDRIALVGDAAHAMLPVGSAGAMAGFLDAIALKDAFRKSGPVPIPNILSLYQTMRYKAAVEHQKKSRLQSAENIVQELLNEEDPDCNGIEIPKTYPERIKRAMKQLHVPSNIEDTNNLHAPIEKRVFIVGGGASGLATCKEFQENGFKPIIFEAGTTFGGVFRDGYEHLELTSSSAYTAFSDYPAKEKVPTMWKSQEYLTYLHNYAVDNGLFQMIQFDSTVVGVKRVFSSSSHNGVNQNSTRSNCQMEQSGLLSFEDQSALSDHNNEAFLWEVEVLNTKTGALSRFQSSILVICVGSNAKPNIPRFPGQDLYRGRIMHTSEINSFDMFEGKRVLCLGIGESGSDVPLWIAKQPGTKVTVAVRGMGWCVPRRRPLKTGLPTDLNTNRLLWGLPRYFNRALSFILAYLDFCLDQDPVIRRMGLLNLQHPAGLYKTYGTKSINFLVAMERLGANFVQSTIANMGSGKVIKFGDGSEGEFDVIVLNTGYQKSSFEGFCFDASNSKDHDATLYQVLKESSYVRNLYKRVLHPAISNLYFVGFARPGFASIPAIAELQARWIAALSAGKCPSTPSEKDMIAVIAEDKAREEAQFDGPTRRVSALVDYLPYVNDIASLLRATPPYFHYLVNDPWFLLRLFFGPATVVQFRLRGPNAKAKLAQNTIESYPLALKRRLHFVSLGLYILSFLILFASLMVPMTSKARKSLFPVGFPPIGKGILSHLRYCIGCIHILALGYFYANMSKSYSIGHIIVIVTSFFELNDIHLQKKNELELRGLLTKRRMQTSAESIDKEIKRKGKVELV